MPIYRFIRRFVVFLFLVFPFLVVAAHAQSPTAIPWNTQRLSQPPAVEWIDAQNDDQANGVRSLFYEGEPYHGKPTRVFAYYASPSTLAGNQPQTETARPQKVPAMVLVHGGGGTAFREWAELWAKRGYAAIAMDLAGQRPIAGANAHDGKNRVRLEDGGPGQGDDEKFGSIDQPLGDQWPYQAVANVILAHSLIRSFDEVDAERTAVTGISWGGYLTCIVAGVDQRFKVAVPVYGCGFLNENSAWLDRFKNMTPTGRERWVKYWDPAAYLGSVSMPILFVNGTNDFAYPLDSYMKSFDRVPVDGRFRKQLCITVNMPHGHPPGWAPAEIGRFVDQYLQQGEPLVEVADPQVAGGEVTVDILGPQSAVSGELHYTTEVTKLSDRQWITQPASVVGRTVKVAAPPAEATAWFLTVKDHQGAVVSTRVVFPATTNPVEAERGK